MAVKVEFPDWIVQRGVMAEEVERSPAPAGMPVFYCHDPRKVFRFHPMSDLWKGLNEGARTKLSQRDYRLKSFATRLGGSGVEVRELLTADRNEPETAAAWIPGVEFFGRKIYPQRHRGFFGEFARRDEGLLAKIGLWPAQWATARTFAGTAKGFHIHPPSIPQGEEPAAWFKRLFIDEPENYKLRPYDLEQWDVMFFIRGNVEMILVDERAGMPPRVGVRFIIEGDDVPAGRTMPAVVIPPGVAHALRAEGSAGLDHGVRHEHEIRADILKGRIASDARERPAAGGLGALHRREG